MPFSIHRINYNGGGIDREREMQHFIEYLVKTFFTHNNEKEKINMLMKEKYNEMRGKKRRCVCVYDEARDRNIEYLNMSHTEERNNVRCSKKSVYDVCVYVVLIVLCIVFL